MSEVHNQFTSKKANLLNFRVGLSDLAESIFRSPDNLGELCTILVTILVTHNLCQHFYPYKQQIQFSSIKPLF